MAYEILRGEEIESLRKRMSFATEGPWYYEVIMRLLASLDRAQLDAAYEQTLREQREHKDGPLIDGLRQQQRELTAEWDAERREAARLRAENAAMSDALDWAHNAADTRANFLNGERQNLREVAKQLIAENAALRDRIDALEAIARQVIADNGPLVSNWVPDGWICGYCGATERDDVRRYTREGVEHEPDCPVTQARALLADDTQGKGTASDE